jgi:hypothetical protein
MAEMAEHFPGITDDELVRGYEIATELLRIEAAEMNLEAARLNAELRRRKAIARRRNDELPP